MQHRLPLGAHVCGPGGVDLGKLQQWLPLGSDARRKGSKFVHMSPGRLGGIRQVQGGALLPPGACHLGWPTAGLHRRQASEQGRTIRQRALQLNPAIAHGSHSAGRAWRQAG